jgi:hypothetical protein
MIELSRVLYKIDPVKTKILFLNHAAAQSCVSDFISNVSFQESDLIIEPSAGNGSFLKPLNPIKCKKIFLDIAPKNANIKKMDFLS